MDKFFDQARNLALALNDARTLIHAAHPAPRPDWIDDHELQQSLVMAASDAIAGLRLGAVCDQSGGQLVLPVLGQYWVCHRGMRSREQLLDLLAKEHPHRVFHCAAAPVALDRINPEFVRIAAEVMEGFELDTSIGLKSIFLFR